MLDLACGHGRHSRYLASRGHPVLAIDWDDESLASLEGAEGIKFVKTDLETPGSWAPDQQQFAGIVVTNYLHRPLIPRIVDALASDGVLIYQTFAEGNEKLGRPQNPDFLLRSGELLDAVTPNCAVVAYECGELRTPARAIVQRICAVKRLGDGTVNVPMSLLG